MRCNHCCSCRCNPQCSVRYNPLFPGRSLYKRPPIQCKICLTPTRGGKEYCLDHVEQQEYVKGIHSQISKREAEEKMAEQIGSAAISPGSLTLQELLLELRSHGKRSLPRLARELQLSHTQVRAYIDYAEKGGLVKTAIGNRGILTVFPSVAKTRKLRKHKSKSKRKNPSGSKRSRNTKQKKSSKARNNPIEDEVIDYGLENDVA